MRPSAPLALVSLVAIALARPAAAIAPGGILVRPGLATPGDSLTVDLAAVAANPCVEWRFAGLLGTTVAIHGERSSLDCPPPVQSVALGQLPAGRYHVVARVPDDPSPLFAQVYFDVAPRWDPNPTPSEIVLAPAQPTTLDSPTLVVSSLEVACGTLVYSPPTIDGDDISIDVRLQAYPVPVPCTFRGTSGRTFPLPQLAEGVGSVTLWSYHQPYLRRTFSVLAPPGNLTLAERFGVTLTWTDGAGTPHLATPSALSDDSGYFWFFGRDNVEVTVKLVDGRALNGSYWFFAASMTDLPLAIDLVWCLGPPGSGAPCRLQRYASPGGNRNFIDTRAFADPAP